MTIDVRRLDNYNDKSAMSYAIELYSKKSFNFNIGIVDENDIIEILDNSQYEKLDKNGNGIFKIQGKGYSYIKGMFPSLVYVF